MFASFINLLSFQSQATALTGRIFHYLSQGTKRENELQAEVEHLQLEVQTATAGKEEERNLHVNATLECRRLQVELETAQKKASKAEEERDALRRDHEGLKKVCTELRNDLRGVERKLEFVETNFNMSEEARKLLERNFVKYKAMGPPWPKRFDNKSAKNIESPPSSPVKSFSNFLMATRKLGSETRKRCWQPSWTLRS